ncbi:hypothetical protein D516_4096 [Rhodobacter sp. AKP1]|nr:hypothetical protein D516_4096 [Rhodobacter sp. AKP1]
MASTGPPSRGRGIRADGRRVTPPPGWSGPAETGWPKGRPEATGGAGGRCRLRGHRTSATGAAADRAGRPVTPVRWCAGDIAKPDGLRG